MLGRDLAVRGATAYIANPSLAVVRDGVLASLDAIDGPTSRSSVAQAVPAEIVPLVRTLAMAPIPQSTNDGVTAYVRGIVGSLVDRDILRRKAELLGSLQRMGSPTRRASKRLQEQLVELERERRSLRAE